VWPTAIAGLRAGVIEALLVGIGSICWRCADDRRPLAYPLCGRCSVDSDPYEPRIEPCSDARRDVVDDGADSRRHPAIGCLSPLLVAFVMFFGGAGILARIEPEELAMTIVIDVLVGVAIFALLALNSPRMFRPPHAWTSSIPALVVAVMFSATLIGWHCFTLQSRYNAIELHRQWRERQSPGPETAK
jgi:hypothetical protein